MTLDNINNLDKTILLDLRNSLMVNNKFEFDKYKNDRLTIIQVNGKSYNISLNVIEYILNYENVYYYFLNSLKRNSSIGLYICFIDNNKVIDRLCIPKVPLLMAINQYINENIDSINSFTNQRIALMNSLIDTNSLYNRYSDREYTCEVDGLEYTYQGVVLLDALFMSASEFDNYVNTKNIDKKVFISIILSFIDDERLFDKYLFDKKIYDRYKELSEHRIVSKPISSSDIDNWYVDEELISVLKDGMNRKYDTIDKAVYIYIKLADLLVIDDSIKSDIDDITLINNKVSKEDFFELYKRVLINFNIDYQAYTSNVKITCGEYMVSINNSSISSDSIDNIQSKSSLSFSNNKLNEKIYSVYKEYHDRFAIKEELLFNIKQYKDSYESYVEITKRDKLFTILKLISNRRLKGNDSVEYIKSIFDKINGDDNNNQLHILYKEVDGHTRPTMVISIMNNNSYQYILIDANSNETVRNISKNELLDIITKDNITGNISSINGLEDDENARTIKVESSRTTGDRQR